MTNYACYDKMTTYFITTSQSYQFLYTLYPSAILINVDRFKELYTKYCEEVYPAKLVFVSFLYNQHSKGQMVTEFQASNMEVMQCVFHRSQPDLTKLDKLFGLLSAETQSFEEQIKMTEERVRTQGVDKVFEQLKSSQGQ